MATMHTVDRQAVDAAKAFVARVGAAYPIDMALLYGSRARGDAREDSDIDIAFIMDASTSAMRQASIDLAGDAFDMLLETGVYVSPIAISTADWMHPDSFSNPFLIRNIQREGIPL